MNPSCLPEVSVITCSYNMGKFLSAAAASVFRQTFSDYEWLVLDDGSCDLETPVALAQLQDHPKVRIFRFPHRLGLTEARNFLLAEARGRFISILDADDLMTRRKLSDHVLLFRSDPNAGVVWGRTLMWTAERDWKVLPEKAPELGWDILSQYEASHSATTWRKSHLMRVGGYDPEMLLVEGPDMFLKVGDFATQIFCPHMACVKRVDSENSFRVSLKSKGHAYWNRRLLEETLHRRSNSPKPLQ